MWTEQPLHRSAPEEAVLGLDSDGTGWMYWASWSKQFEAQMFTWSVRDSGVLAVRVHTELSGTWSLDDRRGRGHDLTAVQRVDVESTWEFRISAGNRISGGSRHPDEPVAVLRLDRPFAAGLTGDSFARVIEPAFDVPLFLRGKSGGGPADTGSQGL
ncbi:hypothetical protein [Frankia sp. AiPa1]|uniref:hypothetical protein n=1 Tax=Frankia sp. AiPa1 TaxID=573492 RepID=UPI00202B439D|nr:hypothetical protein [Frankia sp. AiPa1]MCL9758780.1 hypothetical protein [Frankia sp. AiPa1]